MRRQRTVPVWLTSLAFVFGAALGCSTPGAVTPTEFVMVPGGTEQSLTNTAAPSPPPAPSATISPSPLPPATPFDPSSLSPQVRPILDFYPLAPGAVWTYLATFDMSTGPGPDNATHWAGPITAAVTEGAVEQGFPVFRLDWSGYPDFAAPEFEAEYY